MKRLQSAVTEQYELEVIECDCGYHMGFDASYLLQVNEDIVTTCPSCGAEIDTSVICPEDDTH